MLLSRSSRPLPSAPQTQRTQTLAAIGSTLHALNASIATNQRTARLFQDVWDDAPQDGSRLAWIQKRLKSAGSVIL